MAPNAPGKRKQPAEFIHGPATKRAAKRVKTSSARTILAQTSEKALNKNGDLDVPAFVKAREFEIKAIEASMGKSKASLSSRAFQQVPKDLRRRTASHNVKRVPKRLRARAAKEMKEDNTPTVTARRRKPTPHMRLRLETAKKLETLSKRIKQKREKARQKRLDQELAGTDAEKTAPTSPRAPKPKMNRLADPEKPAAKYRKRQVHKSWLPTHIWHAKRANMPDHKAPSWRFAIPITPTAKVHRSTHRAGSSRGCVAWDTSYMSTISIEGVETSLQGLLRDIGLVNLMLNGKKGARWRMGSRSWHGWVRERDNLRRWIGPVDIVWSACTPGPPSTIAVDAPQTKVPNRQIFVRTHPSSFLAIWNELVKDVKIQHPSPSVSDLRFEIGSIEITGPNATEALVGILHPKYVRQTSSDNKPEASLSTLPPEQDTPEKVWATLSSLTNPSALPPNALLALNVHDPRLLHPPRTVPSPPPDPEEALLNLLATWPPDINPTPPEIFSHTARYAASRLPSQKAINRRKGASPPGTYIDPLSTDPSIPILLLTPRAPSLNQQGTWIILLPWKCVLPTWYSLTHYPLSTGSNPRFGGLDELRQMRFERGEAWFPGDCPGTEAGWQWEVQERAKRKNQWEKRPRGKRISWDAVDLGEGKKGEVGKGWACDWERLFLGPPPPGKPAKETAAEERILPNKAQPDKDTSTLGSTTKPTDSTQNPSPPKPPPPKELTFPDLAIQHIPSPHLSTLHPTSLPPRALSPIHISLLHRGTPQTCARIYRLPTANSTLRKSWLSLLSSVQETKTDGSKSKGKSSYNRLADLPADAPQWEKRQALARQLLDGPTTPQEKDYPACPAEEDLIGFVTTGNFDLGAGRGMAIGNLAVGRLYGIDREEPAEGNGAEKAATRTPETTADAKLRSLRGEGTICIVRNAGQSVSRLGRWEFI